MGSLLLWNQGEPLSSGKWDSVVPLMAVTGTKGTWPLIPTGSVSGGRYHCRVPALAPADVGLSFMRSELARKLGGGVRMKAAVYTEYEPPDVPEVKEVATLTPDDHEVPISTT